MIKSPQSGFSVSSDGPSPVWYWDWFGFCSLQVRQQVWRVVHRLYPLGHGKQCREVCQCKLCTRWPTRTQQSTL